MDSLSLKIAKSVKSYYRPGDMKWHYEHGLVLYASLKAAYYYKDEEIYPWVYAMYDRLIGQDGSIATYREGEYNLDQINAGRALFELYDRSKEERFLKAADRLKNQLVNQPRCLCGVYWHKEIYPWQIWLDGLYMQGPFNAEYAMRHKDNGTFDDIAYQLLETHEKLLDKNTGLLYHAFDESRGQRWSNEITGCSPHFWSRSIGWYLMAILDVLDYLPQGHKDRSRLIEVFNSVMKAVLNFQDESGMWYQVPDEKGREKNYLETSASSMFAYSLFKSVRLGYSNDESYVPSARKAIDAIRRIYLSQDEKGIYHLGGICSVAGLGGNPYRDGSFAYYVKEKIATDDFKGVGPFILACLEEEES